ncbi:MAG: acyl-CoA mutase large subunit family protein [Alphaproteobacteria bacterium]|nr:acyl-CoA mutase large subunit family protein [Alphaproteobacteria bacterium]
MASRNDKSGPEGTLAFPLAESFPPASDDAWLALVKRILGDRSFEDTLVSHTLDGIPVQPLYTAADWPDANDPSGLPGSAPYTRGQAVTGQVAEGWDVCQRHADPDPTACNKDIRADLEGGVTSLLLRFDDAGRRGLDSDNAGAQAGCGGVMVSGLDDLDAILDGVDLEACPIFLQAGAGYLPAAGALIALWDKRGVPSDRARGGFYADPFAALAETGALSTSVERALRQAADLARYTADEFPNVTNLCADTTVYHNAGASEAQELAYAAATGVAYLRALTDQGLSVADAVAQVGFVFATDADFLLSIAKLRAARRIWGRIAEASGAAPAVRAMSIHAVTSERMLAQRDAWVNMLRATVAAFAAAVAGANRLTVLPYSEAVGVPDALGRRIARNTQLVLHEESSLSRVIDPAGGAWAVETLTDALAREAWSIFQDLEKAGGIAAVLQDGSLAASVAAMASERQANVATGADPLTGLSVFPDLAERPVSVREPDAASLRATAAKRLRKRRKALDPSEVAIPGKTVEAAGDGSLTRALVSAATVGATLEMLADAAKGPEPAAVSPLAPHRIGEAFEALRDASDAYVARTGARPTVFLAGLGDLAAYNTPATFASNLFAAGGIEAVLGSGGATAEAVTKGFAASKSSGAVLCSDEAAYGKIGPAAVNRLRDAGAREIYVVGPPAMRDTIFADAPVDGMLYQGADVLTVLTGYLEREGVLHR